MTDQDRSKPAHLRLLVWLFIGITLLQGALGVVLFRVLPDWTARGSFGDMFGVIGTLFSGLAFAGVIYAILLQRNELELQRKELQLTRIELGRSATAHEHAGELISKQLRAAEEHLQLVQAQDLAATRPVFKPHRSKTESSVARAGTEALNVGATIMNLVAHPHGDFRAEVSPTNVLKSGDYAQFEVLFPNLEGKDLRFDLEYTDLSGRRRTLPMVFRHSLQRIEEE